MSQIPDFLSQPLPKDMDASTIARLEEMLDAIQAVLIAVKTVVDDHETRIETLETP